VALLDSVDCSMHVAFYFALHSTTDSMDFPIFIVNCEMTLSYRTLTRKAFALVHSWSCKEVEANF
jgi:hypothetical protein